MSVVDGEARPGADVLMLVHRRAHYLALSLPRLLDSLGPRDRLWVWQNGQDPDVRRVVETHRAHDRFHALHENADNAGLTGPTNWFWEHSSAELVGKVDDDCLVDLDWVDRLGRAHVDIPGLGVVGAWRFLDEDFVPRLARRKIRSFEGGHRILLNLWVQGSSYLMKRECVETVGPLTASLSFPHYCISVAERGWDNGWLYPFVREQHLDDPRFRDSAMATDTDLAANLPLSARLEGVRTLPQWEREMRLAARRVQAAPYDVAAFRGWRRRARNLRHRGRRLVRRLTR